MSDRLPDREGCLEAGLVVLGLGVLRTGLLAFEIPIDGDGRATGVRYYRTEGPGPIREELASRPAAEAVGV
jgi:hypothetical protein